jgi:hypothetical protein
VFRKKEKGGLSPFIKYHRKVLRIRIRDPGLGTFLTPGAWIRDPGWKKVSIRIRDEQPGSYFLELRNLFFAFMGVKILTFFDQDPGWRQFGSGIRDGKKSDPGSGINIPDPLHWENVHN